MKAQHTVALLDGGFPLTPALSLRERENHSPLIVRKEPQIQL